MSQDPSHSQYIVRLRDGIPHEHHFASLRGLVTFQVVDTYDPSFLNIYVARFNATNLSIFKNHNDILDVEEDTEDTVDYVTTDATESWGLARINQAKPVSSTATTFSYTYENVFETGKNVNIYIMDSGIKLDHMDFGGRAKKAYVYEGGTSGDRKGHGTHVAGIAGGATYGVCKAATLYEVKVLDDNGSAPKSRSIKAMQWLASNYTSPAVANMSFGGKYSKIQNEAVDKLVAAGVHVAVAAGNDKKPASESSPASAESAITVGATDKSDAMCTFSNYGSAVDVFAPGYKILSCGISSTTATATKSGTSMAAPFVAGIIGSLISLHKSRKTFICMLMKGLIDELSIKGVISGLPAGTPNKLARGCIHSKTTLAIRNTYEGSLDIDGCSVAIISYVSTLSTSDAKHIDFQNNAQGVKYSYSASEAGTYSLSDLDVVSGQPAIDIFLTNGVGNSSGKGEIDAQFSGNTYKASAETVSIKPFWSCAVVDG